MNLEFRQKIEYFYNIKIQKCIPGFRGQVAAETYVLEDEAGHQYFCKIINKPLLIPGIVRTLPIMREMHDKGIDRICYPVPGKNGLHIFVGDTLIVLFNFIPLEQSYDYDLYALGQLLAKIHALTPHLTHKMPELGFCSIHQDFFETGFEKLLLSQKNDPVSVALQNVLQQYKDKTRLYIAEFLRLCALCGGRPCEFVLTHGDVYGNVLVKSPDDVYIIDWDEMELGPSERDLWRLADKPGFMEGYKRNRPEFILDADNLKYAAMKHHLEGILIYLAGVLDEDADLDCRLNWIQKLEEKRLRREVNI